jgi:AcrR family transcriptional regulator
LPKIVDHDAQREAVLVVDHDAQREAVLVATLRTIAAHGAEGATVRRIAAAAGVSTGFITHYFRDKEEVLGEALRLSNERSAERVLKNIDGERGLGALRKAIEAVLPIDEDRRLEWMIWLTFWGRGVGEHGLRKEPGLQGEQRRGNDLWHTTLHRCLCEAQENGEIGDGVDIAYETERLVVLVAGIGIQARARAPDRFRARAFAFIDDHLAGLAR